MPAPSAMLNPASLWTLGLLLKGTALLVGAFALSVLLRRASAGVRHLVWAGAVVMVLVLPLMAGLVPWRLPVMPVHPVRTTAAADAQGPTGAATPADAERVGAPSGGEMSGSERPTAPPTQPAGDAGSPASFGQRRPLTTNPLGVALALWAAGALIVLMRLGIGGLTVRRIVRAGRDVLGSGWTRPLYEAADRMGLEHAPRLRVSPAARMPFAVGLRTPTIVLPPEAEGWSDRRRRAVLSHELAHLRRRDLAVNLIAQLACAVWWFHPLAWVAERRLRAESERACDDLVLGLGTRASEYADHLLQIVCRVANARTPKVALPMAQRREFEGRMLAILAPDAPRGGPGRRHAAILAAASFALVVPLAALGTIREEVEPSPATSQVLHSPVTPGAPQVADSTTGSRSAAAEPAAADAATQSRPAAERGTSKADERTSKAEKRKSRTEETTSRTKESASGSNASTATDRGVATARQDSVSRIVVALERALQDSVAAVRKDAAYALGQRDARTAVPDLVRVLTDDPVASVREMAAWSLAQIGERGDATKGLMIAASRDTAVEVRATGVWALAQLGDPEALPVLTGALKDASAEVRGRAAWAIGQIEPKTAPDALLAATKDESSDVRLRAAWAMGQIADSAAVPALAAAMKDPDAKVRGAALWALGQMEGQAAQEAILVALQDPDPRVRARAARALAGGGGDPWPWPWPQPRIR